MSRAAQKRQRSLLAGILTRMCNMLNPKDPQGGIADVILNSADPLMQKVVILFSMLMVF